MTVRDVIIVGAGPAGSTCASYLARNGVDVLVVDKEKFPRDKPCGDSQAEVTVSHVEELGALEDLRKVGYRNKGLLVTSPDYTKCYLDAPGERYTTPRRVFDNIMKNTAVRWGAEVLEECWVYDVIKEDGQVKGVKAKYGGDYVELRSKIVIGADGSHSVVAKALDMFPDEPAKVAVVGRCYYENVPMEGYLEIHFDRNVLPGYVWIFPTGTVEGVANVGLGFNADLYDTAGKTLEEYLQIFMEKNPFGERLKKARRISPFKGWRIPFGSQAMDNYAAGAMLIGDAGSFVLPLTGEGIGPAMTTAKIAADVAVEALDSNDFSAEFLSRYAKKWHAALDLKYKTSLAMETQFKSPEAINGFVKKINQDDNFKQQVLKTMFLVGSVKSI